jgi:hypothetical protein
MGHTWDEDEWDYLNPTGSKTLPHNTKPSTSTTPKAQPKPITKDDSDKALDEANFAPFLSAETLHLHVLYNMQLAPVGRLDGEAYDSQYHRREKAIIEHLGHYSNQVDGAEAQAALHSDVKPGDWIETSLGPIDSVFGQVVVLPQTFPEGEYIVKIMMPNSRYMGGYEPMLVGRRASEFVCLDMGPYEGRDFLLTEGTAPAGQEVDIPSFDDIVLENLDDVVPNDIDPFADHDPFGNDSEGGQV